MSSSAASTRRCEVPSSRSSAAIDCARDGLAYHQRVADRNAVLISSRYDVIHDDIFVRSELRVALEALDGVTVELADDYGTGALDDAGILVTYIARRAPDEAETAAVRRFLERGGRWFAIHTSNAVPEDCPLPSVLGSRFVSHPPYGRFQVGVTKPEDSLLQGIEAFETEDELYIIDAADDIEVLLHARWGGVAPNGQRVEDSNQPMLYRRRIGAGEVLYLALGHTNPAGVVTRGEAVGERRGSWSSPVFRGLVARGIAWAARAP